MECKWLPELIYYNDFDSCEEYKAALYKIFCDDLKNSTLTLDGLKIQIRYHPKENNMEEAFYHVTCQDYNKDKDRAPDFRRCERIKWIRKFIENINCNEPDCEDCEGIKVWEEKYKSNKRIHILLEEERYIVVLEKRPKYILLITAFYIEHDHFLDKKIKQYNRYKAKNASQR
ncbi:hypothetical protein [Gallibacter intestinalis]|uniref:Phage P1-related protein n=1 Tax=Gallibacter intestinalis TaxID=2779356 RepID=A0ABR9QYZ2_9FIRM|nr:hypothetical protein [Gallibacter intestinalis]MBE5035800.1 hypothetical protein [Gallibacter intestinalis]